MSNCIIFSQINCMIFSAAAITLHLLGAWEVLLRADGLHPCARRIFTTSTWPLLVAQCNAALVRTQVVHTYVSSHFHLVHLSGHCEDHLFILYIGIELQ